MTITAMFNGKPVRSGKDVWPLERVDHLYTFTASLFEYSFKQQQMQIDTFNLLCDQLELPRPEVHTMGSHGGDESDDYVAKLPALLADAAGKENVLVLFHGFVNDIWNHGPYPGTVDIQIERLRAMVADIKAAGHKVLISTCAYLVPFPSIHYNNAVNIPLIKELTPQYWRNGKSVMDMYQLTLQNPDMLMTDGIHPHNGGKLLFRSYTAEVLADLCLPKPTLPTTEDFIGKRVVISFGNSIDTYTQGIFPVVHSETSGGTNETTGYAVAYNLIATDGTKFYGTKVDLRGHASVNDDGWASLGDDSASLTNANILGSALFTVHDSGPRLTISGLPNGLTGVLSITAAHNTTSTDRVGHYTYKSETLLLDGGAQQPQTSSWEFLVEDNKIVIDWGTVEGNSTAYLGGALLDFVAPGAAINVPPNDYDMVATMPTEDQTAYFLLGGTESESETNLVEGSTESLDIVSYDTINATSIYFGATGYATSDVVDRGGSYTIATAFTVNSINTGATPVIGLMPQDATNTTGRNYIALSGDHATIYHNGAAVGNPNHTLTPGSTAVVLTIYDADAATITMKVGVRRSSILTGTATGQPARNVSDDAVLMLRYPDQAINADVDYHAAAYWDRAMTLDEADSVIELIRDELEARSVDILS